jgi:hypothetical protein
MTIVCVESTVCRCTVSMVMDDLQTFTPRRVYIPPDGWGVMGRSFLDFVHSSREIIKTVTQSNPQTLKSSIQFSSGWETGWYDPTSPSPFSFNSRFSNKDHQKFKKNGWYSVIEEGLCPLHYQDNVGWVWVGVKFQHKSGIHPRLCNLRADWYGMDH